MSQADIWFNGEFVPHDEARVHVLSHALHYGSGVFEGIRAYATPQGAAVLALESHVRRFFRSCKVIHLPVDLDEPGLAKVILETVRRAGFDSCYIRPLAYRGMGSMSLNPLDNDPELMVAAWPWGTLHGDGAIENGIDTGVSSWRRMAPDTHPAMAKATGNYLNSQLVLVEAQQNGFDEGIVLDTSGYVSEGSGENIFVILDGRILTPPLGDSILPGITRGLVIQLCAEMGLDVVEQRVAREMLYFAEEVFFTGTAAEVTPVRSVDRRPVGDGKPGPITQRLQEAFFAIVKGEVPDRHCWLTQVNPK